MQGLATSAAAATIVDEDGEKAPRIDVRRYEALGGLELWSMHNWFRTGCYSAPMLWISAPSSPSVHGLHIRVDGRVQTCGAAGSMMADASDVCVVERIDGQLPHQEDCSFFSLAIPAHLFDAELQRDYRQRFHTRLTNDPRPADAVRRLGHALLSNQADSGVCEELLAELLAVALPAGQAVERACPVRIQRAREFIHARWNEPFSLDELAGELGLTKWHLTRSFAAALGIPPSEYARTVRARHALADLQRGAALAHVALVAGYADQAHMNREIRRIFGFTPGAYRNATSAARKRRG